MHLDFTHPALNEPVSAIGGHYVFDRQRRTAVDGAEMLYYTGFFVMDRSCCRLGGCVYTLVAGFVEKWHCRSADNGQPVSRVRPVTDPVQRQRIINEIKTSDPMIRVSFMSAPAG